MSYESPFEIKASAAETTNGATAAVDLSRKPGPTVHILVDVTAATGTLDLEVQWSKDGTTWASADPADTFTSITAAGAKVKSFTRRGELMRVAWTLSGASPSFTFAIDAYVT